MRAPDEYQSRTERASHLYVPYYHEMSTSNTAVGSNASSLCKSGPQLPFSQVSMTGEFTIIKNGANKWYWAMEASFL